MQPDSRPGSVGAELLGCLLTGLQLATLVLYLLLGPGRISEKDRKTGAGLCNRDCDGRYGVEGCRKREVLSVVLGTERRDKP